MLKPSPHRFPAPHTSKFLAVMSRSARLSLNYSRGLQQRRFAAWDSMLQNSFILSTPLTHLIRCRPCQILFGQTSPGHSFEWSWLFQILSTDDHGSFVIFRSASVRPRHLIDQNFDHFRKAIFAHQPQQKSGILAVGLPLLDALGLVLRGIP